MSASGIRGPGNADLCMKTFIRLTLVALGLLLVAITSALLAMRIAVHTSEVTVPRIVGLTPAEAERTAAVLGLSVMIERQYYSADVAEGKIMMQVPDAGTKVRRGWQVRASQSLGPQRVSIPDVLGESARAADLNIRRRGLDIGGMAYVQTPGAAADQVLAQSPPPNASSVSVPRISLLVSSGAPAQAFVMPSFLGQPLGSVNLLLLDAGFHVGNVTVAAPAAADASGVLSNSGNPPQPSPASIIVSQTPAPGQRVLAGATVNFEVR
jgi:eukaryotic-like serine/threonine-protein kinase